MGFLTEGNTLNWEESKKYIKFIKTNGIKQFIEVYKKLPKDKKCKFMYGDELEYILVTMDHKNKKADILLKADEMINQLQNSNATRSIWHPEYSNYMIEGTPDKPYKCSIEQLLMIEEDLKHRREEIKEVLGPNQYVTTLTAFPRLGCSKFIVSGRPISESNYLSDDVIGKHIRFYTLTENIRLRRGNKVFISAPIYRDELTDPNIGFVHMDCMCFGMGCSCLQCTFQIQNEAEARYLYDMLAIISPTFLTLTAATPVLRGLLVDTDCRWEIISQAVDDRTLDELATIEKSRYATISYYIGKGSEKYNDAPPYEKDDDIDKIIKDAGIDSLLAEHLNYIFIRDPLVIFKNGLPINPVSSENTEEGKVVEKLLDKYENIHSTNWNTVRLKVPVPEVCGWRVEFRPMEIQSTNFTNTSFLVFVNIMIRAILKYKPDWYIPISMVDDNMEKSQMKNALLAEKLFHKIGDKIELVSIPEIGHMLISMVTKYINEELKGTIEQKDKLFGYVEFIKLRMNGEIPTDATAIREFVKNHPGYKKDSYINDEICYDIIKKFYL